jgi:cytochrome c oxidase subunit IV
MAAPVPEQSVEHGHPDARQYILIATVLGVITAIEVTVYYVDALRPILPPTLIALSAVKFALVVMFYMHLKFDHPIFTGMFIFGLATAIFTFVGFLALFGFVAIFH